MKWISKHRSSPFSRVLMNVTKSRKFLTSCSVRVDKDELMKKRHFYQKTNRSACVKWFCLEVQLPLILSLCFCEFQVVRDVVTPCCDPEYTSTCGGHIWGCLRSEVLLFSLQVRTTLFLCPSQEPWCFGFCFRMHIITLLVCLALFALRNKTWFGDSSVILVSFALQQ